MIDNPNVNADDSVVMHGFGFRCVLFTRPLSQSGGRVFLCLETLINKGLCNFVETFSRHWQKSCEGNHVMKTNQPTKLEIRTGIKPDQMFTLNGETGTFKAIGITSQGNVRFVNTDNGKRKLLPSTSFQKFTTAL